MKHTEQKSLKLVNFCTRISSEQRKRWEVETRRNGYGSLAEYVRFTIEQNIRHGVINKTEHDDLTKTFSDLYYQVERIGNNLNQLTRYHHETKRAHDITDILSDLETIKANLETAIRGCRFGLHRRVGTPRPTLRRNAS